LTNVANAIGSLWRVKVFGDRRLDMDSDRMDAVFSEVIQMSRDLLDDTSFAELQASAEAAAALPDDDAARTALGIALSRYPETRAMVQRLAEPDHERGSWLRRSWPS
jgi:hypothetical protein